MKKNQKIRRIIISYSSYTQILLLHWWFVVICYLLLSVVRYNIWFNFICNSSSSLVRFHISFFSSDSYFKYWLKFLFKKFSQKKKFIQLANISKLNINKSFYLHKIIPILPYDFHHFSFNDFYEYLIWYVFTFTKYSYIL